MPVRLTRVHCAEHAHTKFCRSSSGLFDSKSFVPKLRVDVFVCRILRKEAITMAGPIELALVAMVANAIIGRMLASADYPRLQDASVAQERKNSVLLFVLSSLVRWDRKRISQIGPRRQFEACQHSEQQPARSHPIHRAGDWCARSGPLCDLLLLASRHAPLLLSESPSAFFPPASTVKTSVKFILMYRMYVSCVRELDVNGWCLLIRPRAKSVPPDAHCRVPH